MVYNTIYYIILLKETQAYGFSFLVLGLWGLVNNAGVLPGYSPAEWQTAEDFENVCKVNLYGSISVTLTFLPLIRQTSGRIVNVCSVVSSVGLPGIANYCVSKAGFKMFTTCLR